LDVSSDADTPARVVVLMPEVLAHAFHDAECRSVLEMWRDGLIRPVVNHELLALYAKLLRGLNVPDASIRRWLQWFTAQDKAEFLPKLEQSASGLSSIVSDIVQRSGANRAITSNSEYLRLRCNGIGKYVAVTDAKQFLMGA